MSFDSCLHKAESIEEVEDFKDWVRTCVRRILPHKAFACGFGKTHATGVSVEYLLTVDFPTEYLCGIQDSSGHIVSPIVRQWFEQKAPVFFDATEPPPNVSESWLNRFRKYDLCNAAADGIIDEQFCIASYFSFHKLPDLNHFDLRNTFAALTPVLHDTLTRVVLKYHEKKHSTKNITDPMTLRELEIAKLVSKGKSNADIAMMLSLAESTVKNRISQILDKTGCSNRAGLATYVGLQEQYEANHSTEVL